MTRAFAGGAGEVASITMEICCAPPRPMAVLAARLRLTPLLLLPRVVAEGSVPELRLREPVAPSTLVETVDVVAAGLEVVVVVAGGKYLMANRVKWETGAETSLVEVFTVEDSACHVEPVQ